MSLAVHVYSVHSYSETKHQNGLNPFLSLSFKVVLSPCMHPSVKWLIGAVKLYNLLLLAECYLQQVIALFLLCSWGSSYFPTYSQVMQKRQLILSPAYKMNQWESNVTGEEQSIFMGILTYSYTLAGRRNQRHLQDRGLMASTDACREMNKWTDTWSVQ